MTDPSGSGLAAGPAVRLVGVRRRFGEVDAVAGVDLDIAEGEFFSLLGPSGSGKTTTLRLIAGFERPTAGRVYLAGHDVTGAAPFERDVNTVFQDFALFPHLDVAGNVGYGLRVRKVAAKERERRVREVLATVRLQGFERRSVRAMSGGQRQRVALARALVNRPRVLLLDEPLGALDAKLREEMQLELQAIQHEVGITFVFVTHDQSEAFAMSDRVAVFNEGRIEQVGTPTEIYEHPATAFVAGFVGASNLLAGDVALAMLGASGPHLLRPEKIRLLRPGQPAPGGAARVDGRLVDVTYWGPISRYSVDVATGVRMLVTEQNAVADADPPSSGDPVTLAWDPASAVRLPDPRTEKVDR